MSLSIVIPVFKSEENLIDLAQMLCSQSQLFSSLNVTLQPIFVIDGSPDRSREMLIDLKNSNSLPKNSMIVTLSRNFGQVSAILAGLEISKSDCSICYSADMQDPAELFLPMYEAYKSGSEIVLAVREARNDSWVRNLTSFIGYGLLRSQLPEVPKGGFDFFLIGSKAKIHLLKRPGTRRFLQGDILKLGFKQTKINYERQKRDAGKSAYTFRKRLAIFTDAFYDSTDLLIKISTRTGFLLAGVGFFSAIVILLKYFSGISPFNGFTTLSSAILILGGLQLSLIGIIGEYIYRIYEIVKKSPSYIVESVE
jgi:glycosyltransferase involved in cell wall biosynthesis